MIGDQVQVGGERRLLLNEIQQIVGGAAWGTYPLADEIIPDRNSRRAARANPRLTLVAVRSRLFGLFEFAFYLIRCIIHAAII